ncbi:LLM class F420-dependent oxidoreductase [Nocardioides nematodiphilus]|uniref:LLM class F420-dependent oxidoreductase n=1 Tax=Nocardioides nematodiphilus TaxID=2849669 RepID=UPI001CD9E612|nr:LLM class F420-dependent oxidoreductase [Nocardioides nematodiphilus]MCA1983723.1 LLM class F420-dependent oxidoreductase [Nocardioides nematodiphilus]
MDLGLHYANFTNPEWQTQLLPRLTESARIADEGGVDLLTVMDHWFQMEAFGGPFEPMLEGYTTLGYLAGLTERVRLSMLVTGVTYRHPGLLAKTVTTLDVLSGGRALLGIGAAWYDREHAGLGVPFPPLKERFERLEEALQIAQQMWSDDDGPYEGKHYRLAETISLPQPVRGSIPILIGGGGERKTLRLVAQYGDATHLFAREGREAIAHKLDVLRGHCRDVGRHYDTIEKTLGGGGGTDPVRDTDTFLREMEAYAKLGITLFTVTIVPGVDDPVGYTTELVERVLPRLQSIG